MIVQPSYGANTAISITLNSLANNSSRQSAVITNTADEAFVQVKITPASSAAGYVNVWAYASPDGTTFPDGLTGTDAAATLLATPNLRLIGVINPNGASANYSNLFPVSPAFGGVMPQYWGIVITNILGVALASSGNSATYQPVQASVA